MNLPSGQSFSTSHFWTQSFSIELSTLHKELTYTAGCFARRAHRAQTTRTPWETILTFGKFTNNGLWKVECILSSVCFVILGQGLSSPHWLGIQLRGTDWPLTWADALPSVSLLDKVFFTNYFLKPLSENSLMKCWKQNTTIPVLPV